MADQGPLVFVDPDNEQVKLADNVELHFGSGAAATDESLYDIAMRWDGTDFDVLAATADSAIVWGTDGAGIDQTWYGDTASAYLKWDQSADQLIFAGAAQLAFNGTAGIAMADDNLLRFGSSNDVTIEWDTAATPDQLLMLPAADDTLWTIGNGTLSMDIQLFGGAAADYLYWDASDSRLESAGAATVQIGESTTGYNAASPNPMVYGYYKGVTTAVTGTARGVRGNARLAIASAAGTLHGVEGSAGNGTSATGNDGKNLATGRGGYFFFAGTGLTGTVPTVGLAVGVGAHLDIDAADLTITAAHGAHINVQTGSTSNNTVSALYGLTIEHESVSGTAKTMNAMIQLKAVNGNEPVTKLIDASTVGNLTTYDTNTQVCLLSFKGANGTTYHMVHDTDSATAIGVVTTLS